MSYLLAHPAVLALIAVCGSSDRLIGWGGFGRTKPVILAIVALAAIAWWIGLKPVSIATFPVAFLIWRTPGWTLFGGSINPSPAKAVFTFFRHALAFAFLAPAYWSGLDLVSVGLAILGFVIAATLLGLINFWSIAKHNGVIEFLRGCCLGAALGAGYAIVQ